MLKTVKADLTSHGGFVWPESGKVVAPDWNPEPVCGGGLHGLLWGKGGGDYLSWDTNAKWLVCKIDATKAVEIGGDKIKVPECEVVYCGDRVGATQYIYKHAPNGAVIEGLVLTGGDGATLTLSYWDKRKRLVTAYVGEKGIKANTPYKLNDNHKFVEATKCQA